MKIWTISYDEETGEAKFHEDGVLKHEEKRGSLTLGDLVSLAEDLSFNPVKTKKARKSTQAE